MQIGSGVPSSSPEIRSQYVRCTSDSARTGVSQRTDAMCQLADICSAANQPLFDHLVGSAKQRDWNGEPKHVGGLHVDDQIDFRGLLHRQGARFLALENAAGIDAANAILVRDTPAVAHEAAGHDEGVIVV